MTPILVGATVLVIGITFGFNAGYAINPARDLGPRLFTFVAGWGSEVFRAGNSWWWIPLVGPLIGGVLGVWTYDLLITPASARSVKRTCIRRADQVTGE